MFPHSDAIDAGAADELSWIFIILTGISVIYGALGAISQNRLEIHQCLFFSEPLWIGIVCYN